MFEASEALQKMEGMKKIKSMSFHQYSWNSEVEATWISLIGWHHKTSSTYSTNNEQLQWPKSSLFPSLTVLSKNSYHLKLYLSFYVSGHLWQFIGYQSLAHRGRFWDVWCKSRWNTVLWWVAIFIWEWLEMYETIAKTI